MAEFPGFATYATPQWRLPDVPASADARTVPAPLFHSDGSNSSGLGAAAPLWASSGLPSLGLSALTTDCPPAADYVLHTPRHASSADRIDESVASAPRKVSSTEKRRIEMEEHAAACGVPMRGSAASPLVFDMRTLSVSAATVKKQLTFGDDDDDDEDTAARPLLATFATVATPHPASAFGARRDHRSKLQTVRSREVDFADGAFAHDEAPLKRRHFEGGLFLGLSED